MLAMKWCIVLVQNYPRICWVKEPPKCGSFLVVHGSRRRLVPIRLKVRGDRISCKLQFDFEFRIFGGQANAAADHP